MKRPEFGRQNLARSFALCAYCGVALADPEGPALRDCHHYFCGASVLKLDDYHSGERGPEAPVTSIVAALGSTASGAGSATYPFAQTGSGI